MPAESELPDGDETPIIPPAWQPAALYDFEAAGDDPALDPLDATSEIVADTRGGSVALVPTATRGATRPATLATWLRWGLSPHDSPHPEGLLIPGTHAWRGATHLATTLHSWAYDTSEHPMAWKLERLRPHYETRTKEYDQWEAQIAESLQGRQKTLRVGGYVALGALALIAAVLLILGAVMFILLGVVALVAAISVAGRVAHRGVADVAEPVAEELDATTATAVAMGREELETALRLTGSPRVLGLEEHVTIKNPQPRSDGWSVEVEMPPGRMAKAVLRNRHELAGNLNTIEALVHLEPSAGTNRGFTLRRFTKDPFDAHARDADLLAVRRLSVWKAFPVGYTLEEEPVLAGIVNGAHWLFGGGTGSGKSKGAQLLCLAGTMDPSATGVIFDPQRSAAYTAFGRIFEVLQGSSEDDIRAMAVKADWLWRVEMERRSRAISKYAVEYPAQCPDDRLTKEMAEDPDLNLPFMTVVFEEMHSLFASTVRFRPNDDQDKRTCGAVMQRAAQEMVTRARRLGYCVIGVTQKASGKNVDTDIRDIFPGRSCGACSVPAMATMILGDGYQDRGMDPTALIEELHAGWSYVTGSGLKSPRLRDWVLQRYGYVDVNQLRAKLRDVETMRMGVRPELVFANQTPAAAPALAAPVDREDPMPGDPQHLANIESIFEEAERELHSATILGRLQASNPGAYRWLTVSGMNAFLRRIAPELRTANVWETDAEGNPKQAKGLRLSVVVDAYDDRVRGADDAADDPSPSAGRTRSRTTPDQGADGRTGTDGSAPNTPEDPDSAEEGDPSGDPSA
jgi:hypothetical protein